MPAAHHKVESEAATSDEAELYLIHSSQIKPFLTEKVKQFQAGCTNNHFSEWVSHTMGKEILESVPRLSLKFSDKKLHHYHKGLEMRFSSKEELFLVDETKI